jgi:hypothetical protein
VVYQLAILLLNFLRMFIWSISGQNSFFFRLMGLFMNCDKMIGGEFEKGLNKLKSLTEHK